MILVDLLALPSEKRHTFECFIKGYFTIKKSNRDFSNIGIDQAHEQSNKVVKLCRITNSWDICKSARWLVIVQRVGYVLDN